PPSLLRAGTQNTGAGNTKGAERACRRGLAVAPDNVELHNSLGWTLFHDGRSAEAPDEYKRALEIDPEHVKSHTNLALALVELGQLEEAAAHFERSLAREPKP